MAGNVREIQLALSAAGFDPGPIDGDWGALTKTAVMRFQADRGLEIDGIVGPETSRALGLSEPTTLPWINVARSLLGLQEGTARANRTMRLDTKEIPWCGAFVSVAMNALPSEPQPENPLWARNWMKFGRGVDRVVYGAVAVFQRPSGGHVGFVMGHDADTVHVLGGNQSNAVTIARVAKGRLLGYRWPTAWPTPEPQAMEFSTLAGTISTNEA